MQLLPKKPAMTIIEVIIAMTVFVILATSGIMLLGEVSKISQEVEMREYLYTEMQAVLERMSKTIQDSAIDYEEYYSWTTGATTYAESYGDYHAAFFNGSLETGKNPYDGSDSPLHANALCNDGTPTCSSNLLFHQVEALYLIDGSGTERTFFVKEKDTDADAIAMVEMQGYDNQTVDGLIDAWECTSIYTCSATHGVTGYDVPNVNDLLETDGRDNDDFVPITPTNISIDELYFYLSPIEDPYKAFAEDDSAIFESVQVQPKVTIVVTASYITAGMDGPSITLQTTIGTGVYNKIATASSS